MLYSFRESDYTTEYIIKIEEKDEASIKIHVNYQWPQLGQLIKSNVICLH